MYCSECIVSKFQRKILKIKCKLRSNRNKFQTMLIRSMHTIRFLPYTFVRSLTTNSNDQERSLFIIEICKLILNYTFSQILILTTKN